MSRRTFSQPIGRINDGAKLLRCHEVAKANGWNATNLALAVMFINGDADTYKAVEHTPDHGERTAPAFPLSWFEGAAR